VAPPDDLVAFCQREHARLVGAVTLYCGDRALGEEIAQESLAAACERWEKVRTMDAPGAWVHRVAINATNSRFRRLGAERRARRRLEGRHDDAVTDPDGADAVAIRQSLAALPARQRQALVLRFYLGLSVAETARWMDSSEAAVKALTQRAIARLRGLLDINFPFDDAMEVDDVAH
jgi:RNA polymerase sigma-70 factor (ECF subfamily)